MKNMLSPSRPKAPILLHFAFALAVFLLAALPVSAFGQASRFDWTVTTINSSSPNPGGMYPVLAIPGATVQVCATWTPGAAACNSLATTYTSASEGATCPSNKQLYNSLASACSSTSDQTGAWGVWIAPGSYAYVVTTSYGTFGPYLFGVDAGGAYCALAGCSMAGPINGGSAGTAPTLGGDPTSALQATTKQYSDISGGRQAAQRFLYCTQQNTRSCYIDNFGDSTGYDYTSGGPYRYVWRLLNLWVAEKKFPNWNIVYQEWDTGTNAFDAPITFQTGTGSQQMGDVTLTSAGSGQTNGIYVIYDTGSGSAQCVANPGTSHCAAVQVTISGGAITAVVPYNNGQFNQGDAYTSAPVFVVAEGGTPGTITASLYHTIYVSNISIVGSTPAMFQGQYAYTMLTGGSLNAYPDLIINNTGLNTGTIAGTSYTPELIREQLATAISYEQWASPNSGIVAIQQEPTFSDGSHMISEQEKGTLWGQLCVATGIGCVNVYQTIMNDNTPVNQWQADYWAMNVSTATAGSGYTPGTYTTTGTCSGGSGPKLQYTIGSNGSMVTAVALPTSPYVISMGTCPFTSVPSFTIPGTGTGASVTIAAWTGSGIHMADYGFQTKAAYLDRIFVYAQDTNLRTQSPSSLSTLGGQQLAINGSLQSWTSAGVPAYSTAGGSATLSKITTSGYWETKGFALQVADSGGGSGYASFPIYNLVGLAGQWITLSARVFVPNGSTQNAGRIAIAVPTTTGSITTTSYPPATGESTGAYVWRQVSVQVPQNVDGNGTVYLYGSPGTEAVTVYYDRFSVTVGKYLHDVLNFDNTLAQSYAANQDFYGNVIMTPTGTATSSSSPINSPYFYWSGNYFNGSSGASASVGSVYDLGTGTSPAGTLNINFPTSLGAQVLSLNGASLVADYFKSRGDFFWTFSTPATSGDPGTSGQVKTDSNYAYMYTGTIWKSIPWLPFQTQVPTVSTPTAGHAACIKSAGPPVLIGYCSTQPDASGACTCN